MIGAGIEIHRPLHDKATCHGSAIDHSNGHAFVCQIRDPRGGRRTLNRQQMPTCGQALIHRVAAGGDSEGFMVAVGIAIIHHVIIQEEGAQRASEADIAGNRRRHG